MFIRIHRLLLSLLVLLASVLSPSVARGEFMVFAGIVTAGPGSSGTVEVSLINTAVAPLTLSGFSFDLALSGAGVTFSGVDDQTTFGYVFGAEGLGLLTSNSFPNIGFIASDISLNVDGFVTIDPGETVGLARISFTVSSDADSGLRPITLNLGPTTELLDGFGAPYSSTSVNLTNGGIQIEGGIQP